MVTGGQLGLFDTESGPDVDLSAYDVIVLNSSGGKDSQVMLDVVVDRARAPGVADRIVVLYCDLGDIAWPGTRDLAAEQADHYGLRFEVRSRPQGGLLEQVERRGMWPSAAARYCTSDHKRAQGRKLITQLVSELGLQRRAQVLNCFGFRAEESTSRLRKKVLDRDDAASSGVREVWTWLPIHQWTVEQVWQRIRETAVRHHPAYDAGMSRLSCSFCVLAGHSDLVTAARLRPGLAAEYVALEQRIGHDFQHGRSIARIVEEATR